MYCNNVTVTRKLLLSSVLLYFSSLLIANVNSSNAIKYNHLSALIHFSFTFTFIDIKKYLSDIIQQVVINLKQFELYFQNSILLLKPARMIRLHVT